MSTTGRLGDDKPMISRGSGVRIRPLEEHLSISRSEPTALPAIEYRQRRAVCRSVVHQPYRRRPMAQSRRPPTLSAQSPASCVRRAEAHEPVLVQALRPRLCRKRIHELRFPPPRHRLIAFPASPERLTRG